MCNQSSSNWISCQGSDTDNEEVRAVTDADAPDILCHLSHNSRNHADEGATGEPKQSGEDDDGSIAVAGNPECQNNDTGKIGGDNHDIETADAVSKPARKDTTDDTAMKISIHQREKKNASGC